MVKRSLTKHSWIFLILFLLGSASQAQDFTQEFSELKKQEVEILLEKRRLMENLTTFKKDLQKLSHLKNDRENTLTKKKHDLEKRLPLLARLSRVNPLRLLMDTETSQNTLRGMILMRAFSASLKRYLQECQAELDKIAGLTQELKEKSQSYAQLIQDLNFQHAHLIACQKQLINYIEKAEIERLKDEEDVNVLLGESRATLSTKGQKAKTATIEQELPFSWLERPVAGKVLEDLELQNKFSPNGQGMIFETKKSAEVFAPSEGTIVFKGPFKSQGDILIIDQGQKAHTILMGMHKIDAEVGQNVYAGQKLGTMAGHGAAPPQALSRAKKGGEGCGPSSLFY